MKLDTTAIIKAVTDFGDSRQICSSGTALLEATSTTLLQHIQALVDTHQKTLEDLDKVKKELEELKNKYEPKEAKAE